MRMTESFLAVALLASSLAATRSVSAASQSQGALKSDEMKVEDVKLGKGAEVVRGSNVVVNYRLGSEVGKGAFDAAQPFIPFRFAVGPGVVLSLWSDGLIGMKVGGTRRITVPAKMVHGPDSVDAANNKAMIYEVNLVAVTNGSLAQNPAAPRN